MTGIMDIINIRCQKELDQIWNEAEEKNGQGARSVLEGTSDTYDRREFSNDQKRNMTGNSGNSWSTVTYRIALAVYNIRSPAAHEPLLRCCSCLELEAERLNPPGRNEQIQSYICEQSENYQKYKEEVKRKGSIEPFREGILIFD